MTNSQFRAKLVPFVVTLLVVLSAASFSVSGAPATVSAEGEKTSPGGQATVSFAITNDGSVPQAFILDVQNLPEGFSVVDHVDDNGVYSSNDTKWFFQTINAGSFASTSLTLSVPEDAQGEYTVTANAVNENGTQDTATATITVSSDGGDSQELSVDLRQDRTARIGEELQFEADVSGASGDLTYEWEFGDNAIGSGQSVTHQYVAPGEYTVTVTATTDNANQVTDTATVTIERLVADVPTLTPGEKVSMTESNVYQIELSEGESLGLRVGDNGHGNAVVLIYGPDGERIQTVGAPAGFGPMLVGTTAERSGNYYIGVNWTESGDFPPVYLTPHIRSPDQFEPNQDQQGAAEFPPNSAATSLTLSEADNVDWYEVRMDGAGTINVSAELSVFARTQGDIRLQIFNQNGDAIGEITPERFGSNGSSRSDSIAAFYSPYQRATVDEPGIYYVRVKGPRTDGITEYNLTVNTSTEKAPEDTTAPSISNFTASQIGRDTLRVTFTSDERLDNISVEIRHITGSVEESLTTDVFDQSGDGPYIYTGVVENLPEQVFDAYLITAADAAGNDGANLQESEVFIDIPEPPLNATINAPDSATVGEPIRLDADPGKNRVGRQTYYWTLLEAPSGANPGLPQTDTGNVTFTKPGTYRIQLLITESDGEGDRANISIQVGSESKPNLDPICSGCDSPTDLDGDGKYEDVNGNNVQGFGDVVTLFDNLQSDSVAKNTELYDYNDNGVVGFGDVIYLFEQI